MQIGRHQAQQGTQDLEARLSLTFAVRNPDKLVSFSLRSFDSPSIGTSKTQRPAWRRGSSRSTRLAIAVKETVPRLTSFKLPRCPILKSFPLTLLSPTPRLRLYFFHATLTTSPLSNPGGTITAVTVSLVHWGSLVASFRPHAATARLVTSEKVRQWIVKGTGPRYEESSA